MKMNALEKKIAGAAMAYYSGFPEITDEEFDALTDKLPDDHWMRSTPGWGGDELMSILEGKVEIEHREFIGGLPKTKYAGEEQDGSFEITHKLDGITGVVYYDSEGNLENIVTRGNGTVGIRVDAKLNVPDTFIPNAVVRGEIIITHRDWTELQGHGDRVYKHPRNAAAGIVNSTSRELDRFLTFVAFDHYTSESPILTERLAELDDLEGGFTTVEVMYDHVPELFDNTSTVGGSTLPWKKVAGHYIVVDGSVWREVGGSSHAFKYDNIAALATVTMVEWVPTDRGRLAPTVHFSPVELDGATITKASGKSASFIVDNDIGIGTIIEVIRANNVIPDIVKIVSATTAQLPSGVEYYREGANFRLSESRTVEVGMIDVSRQMILDRAIKGIAEKAVNQFVVLKPDIMDCHMDPDQKNGKTYRAVQQALEAAKAKTWCAYELLLFCKMDGVGRRAATSYLKEEATDRITALIDQSELFSKVLTMYDPRDNFPKGFVEPSEVTDVLKVCITGKLDGHTKASFAETFGVLLVDVKDADYVIAADQNSAKAKKALKMGKTIVTQQQFETLGKGN